MIEVVLYSRAECHLCDVVENELKRLQDVVPHKLSVVNIDENPELVEKFGLIIPVVEIGSYRLTSPIDPIDLEITLNAAKHNEEENASIDQAIKDGVIKLQMPWTVSDRFSLWLSKHYLGFFNIFVLVYLFFPLLAPVLMKSGFDRPASWIYKAYGLVCHQLAFRSWFIYGEQFAYPRDAANVTGLVPFSEATGIEESDLWTARDFTGDENIGYKIALCQRDVAIYGGILIFGLIFALMKRNLHSIPWYVWIIIGIFPIGVDGLSQLISQPPLNIIPFRESTPLLRTLTGFLFGFITAWFGYPLVEESMNDTKDYLRAKLNRIYLQKEDSIPEG